jgi:hypothetical protein
MSAANDDVPIKARVTDTGASLSFGIGAQNQPPPSDDVEDALPTEPGPELTDECGRTTANYVSLCRRWHLYIFGAYALILIVVIILVWLLYQGIGLPTLSTRNVAIAVTVLVGLTVLAMGAHWYWFLRGVVPECVSSPSSMPSGGVKAWWKFGFGSGNGKKRVQEDAAAEEGEEEAAAAEEEEEGAAAPVEAAGYAAYAPQQRFHYHHPQTVAVNGRPVIAL